MLGKEIGPERKVKFRRQGFHEESVKRFAPLHTRALPRIEATKGKAQEAEQKVRKALWGLREKQELYHFIYDYTSDESVSAEQGDGQQ